MVLCAQVKIPYGSTAIDLMDLLAWLQINRPELLTPGQKNQKEQKQANET